MKAIVLDFGNVISEPQDSGCYARMASLSGLSTEFYMKAFWSHRPEFDRGDIRGREMYRAVLEDAKVEGSEKELNALADALLEEDLESWFHISREVTQWALSLRRSGYKLGVLSNMPCEFLERYEDKIELFGAAVAAVFSCRSGLIKPEPGIYRVLIERLDCLPGEISFFDDLEVNVVGARAVGLRAHLWTGIEEAQREWERDVAEDLR